HDPIFHSAVMRGLAGVQTLKLSMSVLKNATQSVSTALYTDWNSTLNAMGALFRNAPSLLGLPAREAAGMFASVLDETAKQATLWTGEGAIGRAGEAVLKYTGFTPVERFN